MQNHENENRLIRQPTTPPTHPLLAMPRFWEFRAQPPFPNNWFIFTEKCHKPFEGWNSPWTCLLFAWGFPNPYFYRPLSLLWCASWLVGGRWPPPANISTSKISCAFVRTFLRFQAPQLVSSFLLFHSAIWHSVKMVTQDHYFSITMITTVTIGLLVSLFSQVWHGFPFENKFS